MEGAGQVADAMMNGVCVCSGHILVSAARMCVLTCGLCSHEHAPCNLCLHQ